MINRLAKALGFLGSSAYCNRKNGEHRLGVETLMSRMLLAATVVSQAIAGPGVAAQEPAPAAAVLVVASADFDADFDADGDVNGDVNGDVDGNDLAQWEGDYGPGGNSDADSDGADFLAWHRQYTGSLAPDSIGQWALDETSGTVATDSSGSGNDGTLTNGPSWTTAGRINGGLKFDGSNDFVGIPDDDTLDGTPSNPITSLTVSAWVNLDDLNSDGFIIGGGENEAQDGRYMLWFDDVGFSSQNTNTWSFAVHNGTTWYQLEGATGKATANKWTHVVGVFDGSNSTTPLSIYVDGQLDLGATHNNGMQGGSAAPAEIRSTNVAHQIGRRRAGVGALDGTLDELNIYDTALTTTEVVKLFNSVPVIGTGTTHYVDDDDGSSDSNPGTSTQPFKTIQHAADIVNPGDTVIVKEGVYLQTVRFTRTGTSDNWITFKSENKWGAVLDGSSSTGTPYDRDFGVNFQADDLQYISVENFEIRNYKKGGIHANKPNNSHLNFYGNRIHHIGNVANENTNQGFDAIDTYIDKDNPLVSPSEFITIDSNVIHDIGKLPTTPKFEPSHDHGVYTRGYNCTIKNNLFYNIRSGWAVSLSWYGVKDQNHKVINNTIIADNYKWDPAANPDTLRWGGILVRSSSNSIENNTIIVPQGLENKFAAINYMPGHSNEQNIRINNNLTNSNVIATNSGISGNTQGNTALLLSGNITGATPSFVGTHLPSSDPEHYVFDLEDFRPNSTSLAIDAGIGTNAPPVDHEGTARPIDGDGNGGAQYDIGAFEFVGSSSLLAPPEGEESSEVSPATQGELFDAALAALVGSSGDDASARPQYTTLNRSRTFELEAPADLARQFDAQRRFRLATPDARHDGNNDRAYGLEQTEQNREEAFDSLFSGFDEVLTPQL